MAQARKRRRAASHGLAEFLLQPPPAVAAALLFAPVDAGQLHRRIESLASRGYLGCLPIARTGQDDLVIRMDPAMPPDRAPVAVAWGRPGGGLTISPGLRLLVAGRLAQIDCSAATFAAEDETLAQLIAYAEQLGDSKAVPAVLESCKRIPPTDPKPVRCGKLWAAAGNLDPLFKVLGGAWMYEREETGRWLKTLRGKARNHPIAVRLRIGYRARFQGRDDVSEDAWEVVFGDHVFDLGYTALGRGPVLGSRKINALASAVGWLRENRSKDRRFSSPLWRAAQLAVDEPRYDGTAHFDAAVAMGRRDPRQALVHLKNAAAYAVAAGKARRRAIAAAATALAKRAHWLELAEVFSRATRD